MQTEDDTQPQKSVLLVEDRDFTAPTLEKLESLHYNVTYVTGAGEALSLCAKKDFQLVLLDIDLILFTAFWIAEELRDSNHTMPILGYRYRDISTRLLEMALESGMQDLCEHWVSEYMLVQTLNKWCPNHVTLNYKYYW